MVEHALEPIPLLVAAIVGAVVFWYLAGDKDQDAVVHGALTGALVQIAVRVTGVS